MGSLDEVPALLAHGYQASAYVVTEGGTSRLVTPEWIDVAASSDDGPMLGAVGDTLVAHLRIGHSGEQGSNTIWTSPDGESWTEFDAPWPDTWEVWCCPLESSGVGIVQINDGQAHWAFELWRSMDGASWQPAAVPPEIPWDQPAQIAVVNERWVAAGGGLVATSVDGDVWETLATDALPAGDSHTVWSGGVAYRSLDGASLVIGTF